MNQTTAFLALAATVAVACPVQAETCSGEFSIVGNGFYMIGWCRLNEANARKVMQVCSLGQQCIATGTIEHCPGVRGACAELTRITSLQWGSSLPRCTTYDAVRRADQYWSNGSSVTVKGTIVRSKNIKYDVTPPYGHISIVMDLTTCTTGSPMPVDRVPERFAGHYVELKGTAIKGPNGWYIIARQIDDAKHP
jgi:hypothetical protein